MVQLSRLYHVKFFKGCVPQILLGPFLSTLIHLLVTIKKGGDTATIKGCILHDDVLFCAI